MSALIDSLAAEARLPADDHAQVRRGARKALLQYGFPDMKTEAWKYTSLRVLEKREFSAEKPAPSDRPVLPFEAVVLHFDNGILATDGLDLPEGVSLVPQTGDQLAVADYGDRSGAFAWLNLARFEQAWHLRIEGRLERPLVIATGTAEDFQGDVHPRLFIELAAGAQAEVVEVQQDRGQGLVNIVQDITLGPGAILRHLVSRRVAQSAWIQRSAVTLARDADYRFHVLDRGGRLTRHDLNATLVGAGANAEIDGTVLVNDRQHVDFHTAIDHQVGHTNSRESFRILADGSGVGVFNGRIHIARGADDSHSDLNTANLLLSESARINAKPELEIYAEEVTASHGATIGQLDDTALFYMRSRGIPASEAAALLKQGFAAAPLENIQPEPIRTWLLGELKNMM
ncbi:MAG: Fe-S cluster assembly protein SufD [Wenzhouxiangella sp.]|nr:MAG: Fe-S cluster assembly protein SufD [Wenzhouxiangella sp.]